MVPKLLKALSRLKRRQDSQRRTTTKNEPRLQFQYFLNWSVTVNSEAIEASKIRVSPIIQNLECNPGDYMLRLRATRGWAHRARRRSWFIIVVGIIIVDFSVKFGFFHVCANWRRHIQIEIECLHAGSLGIVFQFSYSNCIPRIKANTCTSIVILTRRIANDSNSLGGTISGTFRNEQGRKMVDSYRANFHRVR